VAAWCHVIQCPWLMEFVEMVMFENIETITGLYKLEALGDSKHPLRQLVTL